MLALDEARRELKTAGALAAELSAAAERGLKALSEAVQEPLAEGAPDIPTADARFAEHRVGPPSKIDRDPELEAFIRARIDRMTFGAVVDAVAAAFPPERRVSRSGLHRWWHRRCAAERRGNRP